MTGASRAARPGRALRPRVRAGETGIRVSTATNDAGAPQIREGTIVDRHEMCAP